jgi:hypothetical protein
VESFQEPHVFGGISGGRRRRVQQELAFFQSLMGLNHGRPLRQLCSSEGHRRPLASVSPRNPKRFSASSQRCWVLLLLCCGHDCGHAPHSRALATIEVRPKFPSPHCGLARDSRFRCGFGGDFRRRHRDDAGRAVMSVDVRHISGLLARAIRHRQGGAMLESAGLRSSCSPQ